MDERAPSKPLAIGLLFLEHELVDGVPIPLAGQSAGFASTMGSLIDAKLAPADVFPVVLGGRASPVCHCSWLGGGAEI